MARIELPQGIAAIHGRLGNLIYRSRKQPDGTYKVFVSEAPAKKPQRRGNIEPTSNRSRANYER